VPSRPAVRRSKIVAGARRCTLYFDGLILLEPLDVLPCPGARLIPPLKTKPIRTVLRWQVIATAAVAAVAGAVAGWHGALSAVLGGLINVAAGFGYALLLGLGLGTAEIPSARTSLLAMARAEAGKILLIVGGLWLVLSVYRAIVPAAFFTAFVITVVIFSTAFFVRD
jgi:ATP synthase protein I